MTEKDYYKVLGIQRNATQDEIKKAFRSLSKKFHPDVCKESDGEEKFKEINEAYTILSDPEKKRMFDTYGTVDPSEINQGSGYDPFGQGFNPFGGFANYQQKEQGENLKITVELGFDELFYGVHKKIKITKNCSCHRCNGSGSESNSSAECPNCHGSGYVTETRRVGNTIMQSAKICPNCHGTGTTIKDPCPNCHGSGLEKGQKDVEFDVPAGMYGDAYFVIQGEGSDGPHRGIPGDLSVYVKETPNKDGLKRDRNNNIIYTKKISYKTLVFGGDIDVPYIGGLTNKIHIEAGSESGKVLKLFGKGFPNPNDNRFKGDYIITIECDIPKIKELTNEDKELIKKLPN